MRTPVDVATGVRGPRTFACYTPVEPARVWTALTDATRTPAYLYGLSLHSTWARDASIRAHHDCHPALSGRVLCARPGERLSYFLHAGPGDLPVYLTWLIRPSPGGCTVRLEIDEVDRTDATDEAEDIWLPVLAALQKLLA